MERRHVLMGIGGATAVLAGCNSSSDESDGPEGPFADLQELPETEALLTQHRRTLDDRSFTSEEERIENASEMGASQPTTQTIRSGEAGTLVKADDIARNLRSDGRQAVWFTGTARISRITHTFNPNGITPPYIDAETVSRIVSVADLERVDVTGDDQEVYVFEASSTDEETARELDLDVDAIDVRMEIAAAGYIRSIETELTAAEPADAEQATTTMYQYDVTELGDVPVSEPDFVSDAVRIEGELSEDGSTLVLNHAGGPAVSADTELILRDANVSQPQRGATFPTAFESGDEAHVYWTATDEPAISMGGAPSEVAREVAVPSQPEEQGVFLSELPETGPERFVVRIGPRE
ncbi:MULTISPECIES: hypothetical protein [unclassified Natrinema]|uniref:hypothetical protein n=1 Tax=unclassified Natrinema TaxID=2622230 RepID=UPI00026D4606|nr:MULTISPECIES: hypothetical protein [unclassified Natrinema]AFO56215.1 hypothetical protein NJ7G_0968 [Natrinema sp. J7-2]